MNENHREGLFYYQVLHHVQAIEKIREHHNKTAIETDNIVAKMRDEYRLSVRGAPIEQARL